MMAKSSCENKGLKLPRCNFKDFLARRICEKRIKFSMLELFFCLPALPLAM